jgi:DNA-binding beta-propeller fold protein YncE
MSNYYIKIIIIIIITNIVMLVSAEITSYCDYNYSIYSSQITSKVYLACSGSETALELITIDPETAIQECAFSVDGLVQMVIPVDNSDNLLILLAEVDGNIDTFDGCLQKVDASNGSLITGFEYLFDEVPLTMVSDENQNYVYVSYGLSTEDKSKIMKLSLNDFSCVAEAANYGYYIDKLALSSDGSKLYVKNKELHLDQGQSDEFTYFTIGVFNTNDMTLNKEIKLPGAMMPNSILMGNDYRLFVSNSSPRGEYNSNVSLVVIDTRNDIVIKEISLNENGISDIRIDMANNVLYGIKCPRDYYESMMEEYVHRPSAILIKFDLTDPDYTPSYLTLANEGLLEITIVNYEDCSRVFATADSPQNVYYSDL